MNAPGSPSSPLLSTFRGVRIARRTGLCDGPPLAPRGEHPPPRRASGSLDHINHLRRRQLVTATFQSREAAAPTVVLHNPAAATRPRLRWRSAAGSASNSVRLIAYAQRKRTGGSSPSPAKACSAQARTVACTRAARSVGLTCASRTGSTSLTVRARSGAVPVFQHHFEHGA